jgi:hypothetical protein
VAERQRRLAVESMQRWMEHNARIIKIIAQVMREGLNRCTPRSSD